MKLARLFFKRAAPREHWEVVPGRPVGSGLPPPDTGRSIGQRVMESPQEVPVTAGEPRRATAFSNMSGGSNVPGARGTPDSVGSAAARRPGLTPSMFGDTAEEPRRATAFSNMSGGSSVPGARGTPDSVGSTAARRPGLTPSMFGDTAAAGPRIVTSTPPADPTPGRGGRNWRSWATHLLAATLGMTGVGGAVGLAQLRGANARRAEQDAAGAAPTPDPTESETAVTGEDPKIRAPADQSSKPATSKKPLTDLASDGPPQTASDSQSPQGRRNWQQVAPQLLIGSGIGAAALLAYLLTSRDD